MRYKTALLAVNLQNLFTQPGGALYSQMTGEVMRDMPRKIDVLRARGILIVYVTSECRGDERTLDPELVKRRDPIPMSGSPDAGLDPRLTVDERDLIVSKYASSALFENTLDQQLQRMEVKNIITCGFKTNFDVRATATEAMSMHYQAFVAADMVGSDTRELSDLHLGELTKYTAKAIGFEEICNRLDSGIF